MSEISRARQRANAREARKYGPTGYTARQLAAVALGVFVAGAALGTTAGLLIGGGGERGQARLAARHTPAAPEVDGAAPIIDGATRDTSTGNAPTVAAPTGEVDAAQPARVPTSGYAQAPEPAQPPPIPDAAISPMPSPTAAERPVAGLFEAARITDRLIEQARRGAARVPDAASKTPPAWRRNAASYPEPGPGVAKIAVVIDDLGLNRPNAREMLGLPGPLTLAFMTYAPSPGDLTEAARAAGHELLVHVPMQPSDAAADPGPKVLSGELDRAELMARLDWGLSRFEGYVGINNHMGSAFTQDGEGMRAVMAELKRRGLMFLDSRTISGSVAGPLAREMGVVHATRDVFLDNDRDVAAIRAQLDKVERIARETGSAIAIGHPYDETIRALRSWLPTLAEKNIALVPISALAKGRGPDVAQLPAGE